MSNSVAHAKRDAVFTFSAESFSFISIGRKVIYSLLAIIFILAYTSPSWANSSIDKEYMTLDQVSSGELLFKTTTTGQYIPAIKQHTDVAIQVNGMVASVEVMQSFTNLTDDWAEGVYVFQLPNNAAVNQMRIEIGERIIEGEIHEKQQAKQIYQQARDRGQRAGLVEQERPNLFTMSVANIASGETVRVHITYLETVAYDMGRFRLRFPTAITPRYIPGEPLSAKQATALQVQTGTGWTTANNQVPDASRITPHLVTPNQAGITDITNTITLSAEIDAGFTLAELTSSYHAIDTSNDGTRYEVSLANPSMASTRDFELVWQPDVGQQPAAAIFSETVSTESTEAATHALLMLMPPSTSEQQDLPREAIFVIDTSGSMDGTSIEQARQALLLALERLQPHDSFNIYEFNSDTYELFSASRPANEGNISQARRWVRSLQARGGTEMAPAIFEALSSPAKLGQVRQVLFMTDGAIGSEDALFTVIEQNLANARLFTVGIGSAPNSHFMQRAAEFGRGTYTYIGQVSEVTQKMQDLFAKLESPVLTNLKITWPNGVQVEAYPARLPDLYLGEPLVVKARMDQMSGVVNLSGMIAGQPWQQRLQLSPGMNQTGVSSLWARAKIAQLSQQQITEPLNDSLKPAITDVALQYQLVSQYTSFVAVDKTPARDVDDSLTSHALKNNLPAGQNPQVHPQAFANTALGLSWHLWLGILTALAAGLLWLKRLLANRVVSKPAGNAMEEHACAV